MVITEGAGLFHLNQGVLGRASTTALTDREVTDERIRKRGESPSLDWPTQLSLKSQEGQHLESVSSPHLVNDTVVLIPRYFVFPSVVMI